MFKIVFIKKIILNVHFYYFIFTSFAGYLKSKILNSKNFLEIMIY